MEYQSPTHAFPTQYAVLGFLSDRPGHGYEIRERIQSGLGDVWYIAMSQLYRVLQRLESDGLIHGSREQQAGRPARTVYRVTSEGEAVFLAWASAPVEHVRDLRVEFFAKLYFLRRVAPKGVARLVSGQREMLQTMQDGLETRDGVATDDDRLSALTLDFRRTQVAGTLDWLDRHREELVSQEDIT